MRITLFVFLACLSACAATSGSVLQTEPRPDLPVERKAIAAKDPLINGVWRSRGYGWILGVEDGAIRQYEAGGFGCYARPQNAEGQTAMLSLPFSQYRLSTNGETAMFMYGPDTTGPIFERLPALPDACAQPAKTSVEASFDIFLSMFDEHYAHFGDRGADWPKLAHEAQVIFNANPTEKGFIEAADYLLKVLQDSHTRLIAFTQEGRQRIQYGLGETLPRIRKDNGETAWLIGLIEQLTGEILDPGARHVGEDRILWGTIGGEIGYLQIFQMGGFAGLEIDDPDWAASELRILDQELDEAFAAFANAKAVILDLSNNRGGYDEIARRLAARFSDAPFHAYNLSADGDGLEPLAKIIEPEPDHRFTGPVYLLTSDVTVSGGEIATLSLRQLPNVTQVGQPTRGAFSTPLAKILPNGWIVELANETFSAPDGEVFAGRGIPPQKPLDVFSEADPVGSHGEAIRAIVALIRETDD